MSRKLKLACLISGGGRTLINIADRISDGFIPASIELVISSRASAPGVERAKKRGLDVRIAGRKNYPCEETMHDVITSWFVKYGIDLVCLCGYLRWLRVDHPFEQSIINIHPALLPDFAGKGMYGHAVHRAVLESKRDVSGCSIHFVDDQYDHGPVILQRVCPVLPKDTEHSLAARVFEQESIAYPAAIRLFAEDRIKVENNEIKIDPPLDPSWHHEKVEVDSK